MVAATLCANTSRQNGVERLLPLHPSTIDLSTLCADTAAVPREITAVPAARSSDKAFRLKQGLVIGGVLTAAALGPIGALISITSRVDVPLLQAQVTKDVRGSIVVPEGMLATADLVADAWANGRAIQVPHLVQVAFESGSLGLTAIERLSYVQIDLSVAGLSPLRYESAWEVYYRALRSDGTQVFINVPMAITVPHTAELGNGATAPVRGVPVLRAAPSLEPYVYPLKPEELGNKDVLVPSGWEPVTIADTSSVIALAQRWATAYLQNRLSGTPGSPLDSSLDKNQDALDDVLDPPAAELTQALSALPDLPAYKGLGGYNLAPGSLKVVSGPYKASADNTVHAGHLLMTVSFGALGSQPDAPTLTPVTMAMDLLVKAESNTVLAWGPAGSGASLTSYSNHTIYRAWQPSALGE